jgi:hypothetical protein
MGGWQTEPQRSLGSTGSMRIFGSLSTVSGAEPVAKRRRMAQMNKSSHVEYTGSPYSQPHQWPRRASAARARDPRTAPVHANRIMSPRSLWTAGPMTMPSTQVSPARVRWRCMRIVRTCSRGAIRSGSPFRGGARIIALPTVHEQSKPVCNDHPKMQHIWAAEKPNRDRPY